MTHHQQLNLEYSLHPLISELNIDLLRQNPYNPLKFIKLWATKKMKSLYSVDEDSSEEEEIEKEVRMNVNKRIVQTNGSLAIFARKQPQIVDRIKRRNAVFYCPQQDIAQQYNEIAKSQQAKSRIMISLKSDPFFKHLSWQQIGHFVELGKVFSSDESMIIQHVDEPLTQFFIVVSGEIILLDRNNEQQRTFYTGECLCHESFLHYAEARWNYVCKEERTVVFVLKGSQVKETVEAFERERFEFFEKVLMNKEELNYLDYDEREKVVALFISKKEIMAGEVVFRDGSGEQTANKRFYVVVKGQFSKCKKNSTRELVAFKTLREGDFFGEENLLQYVNIDYNVICLQDNSEIAYIDKQSLQQAVDSYQRIIQRAKMQVKYIA